MNEASVLNNRIIHITKSVDNDYKILRGCKICLDSTCQVSLLQQEQYFIFNIHLRSEFQAEARVCFYYPSSQRISGRGTGVWKRESERQREQYGMEEGHTAGPLGAVTHRRHVATKIWVNIGGLLPDAPSLYLNQCSLIINGILWYLPGGDFTRNVQDIHPSYEFRIYQINNTPASHGEQWVNNLRRQCNAEQLCVLHNVNIASWAEIYGHLYQ